MTAAVMKQGGIVLLVAGMVIPGAATASAQVRGGGGRIENLQVEFGAVMFGEKLSLNRAAIFRNIDAGKKDPHLDKRLTAWCSNYRQWLDQQLQLTDHQSQEVDWLLNRAIANTKADADRRKQLSPLFESTVIVLAGQYGPATRLTMLRFDQDIKRLLLPAQAKRFDEANRSHLQQIGELYAERAASVIAKRLYLDRATHDAVLRAASWKIHYRSDGLFDFSRHTDGLTYRALTMFVQSLDEEILPKPYVRYWCHLREGSRAHETMPIIVADDKSVEEQLAALQTVLRKQLASSMTIRHEYLTTALELSADQSRRLQVAAKGATSRQLNSWKQSAVTAVRQHADKKLHRGQLISIVSTFPTSQDAAEHTIWTRAVEDALNSAGGIKPDGFDEIQRSGATAFVLGTLTRELFLTDEQQTALRPLISDTHPEETPDQPVSELAMIVRTMLRIQSDKVSNLLDESQLVCWNLIRDSFSPSPDERTVLIPSRTRDDLFVQVAP